MKKLLFLFLLICTGIQAVAQGNMKVGKWRKTEVDSLTKAQLMFEEQNFTLALPIFMQLQQNHPKELYLKYVTGICGLYRSDVHAQSLEFLLEAYQKNKRIPEIAFDLARAYHYNYKFDEAIALIGQELQKKKITEPQKTKLNQLRSYCTNGKELVASPVDATIENAGDIVNTVSSEYVPVVSSDESVMIFTYVGDQSKGGRQNAYGAPDPLGVYFEDVFITHREGDSWVTPGTIGDNINTTDNDAAIAISNDGQKLFIFKDDRYTNGDIYISQLEGDSWSIPKRLEGSVNTLSWEGSASLSADEKTLYFASEVAGGLGGRDLYQATLQPDGSWGHVKNMGPTINTPLDDDAPFIHPDGKTLIYSSKGLNSMGDYDIFVTRLQDSVWSVPQNIGYPINTPDDDRYLVVSASGERGYYASGKPGGFGLHDIYVVDMPSSFERPPLAMLKGQITLDGKPVVAEVKVRTPEGEYGTFHSAAAGNYLVNLKAGKNYTIEYKLDTFAIRKESLNITDLHAFLNKTIDVEFISKKDTVAKDSVKELIPHSIPPIVKDTVITAPAQAKPMTEADIIAKHGNSTKTGLEFKVQIAAYNLPKNYNYEHLKGLGKVEKLLLEDGITRFTIGGSFATLNEAIAHKEKVQAAGQKDAFVTAIYNGKRVYLEDLEQMGLIPPQKK